MTAIILGGNIFIDRYRQNIKCEGRHRFRSKASAFDYLAHLDDTTIRYNTVDQCDRCLDWHIVRKNYWKRG